LASEIESKVPIITSIPTSKGAPEKKKSNYKSNKKKNEKDKRTQQRKVRTFSM